MGSISAQQNNHQDENQRHSAIDITCLSSLQQKLMTPPSLLRQSAGCSTCSIFRIPQSFKDVNSKLYKPQIVSIGPFNYGEPHLQMIQQHKYQYLRQLLSRLENHLTLSDLFKSIRHLEPRARESYSESIHLDSNSFLELLIVDGCFILELFRKVSGSIPFEPDDPIKSMTWIFSCLLPDLLMLENQIPFFILQSLFDTTWSKSDTRFKSITTLSLNFFSHAVDRLDIVMEKFPDLKGQHLLDLLRMSFVPNKCHVERKELPCSSTNSQVIHCVSKLCRAGIKLRNPKNYDAMSSFLNVKFSRGVIEMPMLTVDDFMSCLIANCVAYELSYKNCPTYFTTYITLLNCLINNSKDVEYLCDRNIIDNYFGNSMEVTTFINSLGTDVAFDINQRHLVEQDLVDFFNEEQTISIFCFSLKNPATTATSIFTYTMEQESIQYQIPIHKRPQLASPINIRSCSIEVQDEESKQEDSEERIGIPQEILEELDEESQHLLKQLISKLEEKLQLDKIVERLHDSRAKAVSEWLIKLERLLQRFSKEDEEHPRGLDPAEQDLVQKLERFKVKTLDTKEGVKSEKK